MSPAPGKLGRLLRTPSAAAYSAGQTILVVDDTRSVRELLCTHLRRLGGFTIESAGTLGEVRKLIVERPERFFCAVLDLNLSDAPNGEVVDEVIGQGIPVVVLTGSADEEVRRAMLAKPIVDYLVKRNANEIEQVAYILGRLRENRGSKIIIVDDSSSSRARIDVLLKRYFYQTVLAVDGREALTLLERHPDTTLVIADVDLPVMDGFELIAAIRAKYRREDLAIIGLSDSTKSGLSAKLLKLGANDFLAKPFGVEEFYCRITQSTNMVGYVRQIRDYATRDFLTGVFNRRQLFEMGATLWSNARRGNLHIAAAMIDADHFKRINDTHGHDVGDMALKAIAGALQETLRKTDIVARYGGEEFVCIAVMKSADDASIVFERIREAIEALEVKAGEARVPITVSLGVTTDLCDSLELMLKRADDGVYEAKRAGRNRVVYV